MKRFFGLSDVDFMIGAVACFGAFLIALLLLVIAPHERTAVCGVSATTERGSHAAQDCTDADTDTTR